MTRTGRGGGEGVELEEGMAEPPPTSAGTVTPVTPCASSAASSHSWKLGSIR